MSVQRHYLINCDECGEEWDDSRPYLVVVRRLARRDGWLSTPDLDLCPDCQTTDDTN